MNAHAALARRYSLAYEQLEALGHTWRVAVPGAIDELLDDELIERHARLPYWAQIWPAARVLADRVALSEGGGRRLLELGCGVGWPSLVAAARGFDVLATDYCAEALEFAHANIESNAALVAQVRGSRRSQRGCFDTRLVDWHKLPDDLGQFDLVVAADVLFEAPLAPAIADVLARTLAPCGRGLLTDPSRSTAASWADECARRGLSAELVERVKVRDGRACVTVNVFKIRRESPARL